MQMFCDRRGSQFGTIIFYADPAFCDESLQPGFTFAGAMLRRAAAKPKFKSALR
jgi:hypothetical protein